MDQGRGHALLAIHLVSSLLSVPQIMLSASGGCLEVVSHARDDDHADLVRGKATQ